DYEGAEIIADLNHPLSETIAGRFDLLVDGGTLEHVFAVRQALMNVAELLKPGGRAIHITPTNNYCNHGFYQCSPTLFVDYYRANGFTDLQVYVAEEIRRFGQLIAFDVYRFDPDWQPARLLSPRPMAVLFSAEKTSRSSAEIVPTQWYYSRLHGPPHGPRSPDAETAEQPKGTHRLRRLCPSFLQKPARGAVSFVRRVILRRTPQTRPWGLECMGRWT